MSRWLKILLSVLVVAGVTLFSLPWWLGLVLGPVLRSKGITFELYERAGYAHFRLVGVHYANAGFGLTARQVQTLTPLAWLGQRLRGAEPSVMVANWRIERTPSRDLGGEKLLAGMPDLAALLRRISPRLGYWLPRVHLTTGEFRGFGPTVTIAGAHWIHPALNVEDLRVADHVVAFVIVPAADGSVVLTAHTAGNEARLRLAWSGSEIKGEATLWNQPLQLAARFPAQGWLPAEASAVAADWRLPAARARLGVPYAEVLGDGRLLWRDGAFDLSVNARAEPAADNKAKAPPFEARVTAHGNLHELTLTELHVDAPFAMATLTAPVTFSLDHPPSAEAARLVVQADLAKLPWLEARGRAEGTVSVTGDHTAVRQDFEIEFTDVGARDINLKKAHARGFLQWPQLELTELTVQLDKASSLTAHGAVNWQTRELTGVALKAKLESASLSHWLPAGASWSAAEFSATAEGPLAAPRHQGSLKLMQAQWKPLQPLAVEASWRGEGARTEISATATAQSSTLEFAGALEPPRLTLNKFQFTSAGQPVWQLAAPAQLTWAPAWQVENLHLSGPASQLTLQGKGGPDGALELHATGFDSAWLRDWVTITGPGWQLRSLQATGRLAGGGVAFETELTAQIEMSPQPAQVRLVASGDAHGVQLKELKVFEGDRVFTQATGRLPVVWTMSPAPHLSVDEAAPLELTASTDPDSPLWATLAAYTGLELAKPEASINLKGTLRRPAGELQLKVARINATEGRFKFPLPELEDAAAVLQFGRETLTLSSFSAKVEGQAVRGSGQLPMDEGSWQQLWRAPTAFDWSKAEARVEIPEADLAPIARRFPSFVAVQGKLRANFELKSDAKFSGELHLTDAASRPLSPFGTLQEIKADLVLADRTVTLHTLTAKLGGEPVALEGSATLAPGGAPRLALSLKGKNLPLVRNTGLLLRVDLDLQANTDAAGVTRLGGTVEVRDCLMLASLSLRSLLPTGRRGVTRQPPYFSVEAEPFRHWPLAVGVRAVKSVRLRTTAFNGTASARFQLGGTLGEPRAVGDLSMDQGQVLFPFATFKVQSGTVRLREADPFHAIVNLTASSQRRDYQLRLEATGELPTPNILLSSTPSLEAGEVLLMVMTGQPPLGGVGSSSAQRLVLLGAYLSRGLFQDLGIGGEERLEVSAGEQVSQEGRDTYEFEYKFGKRWSALGEYDRFDAYNAGVRWHMYTQESVRGEKK
jgi:translocation and assembly module TamB